MYNNKSSGNLLGGDGIQAELYQILKDDAIKVLHSVCQQIWKTQQWPQDWKRSVFIPIPKKDNAKECSSESVSHALVSGSWDPMYCSPPGSCVHRIFQARILEWVKMKVKVAESCPTLWDPMDYTVHGILQARTLERVAFPFSTGSS